MTDKRPSRPGPDPPLTTQAHSTTTELIDRAMFDGTVERTADSLHIAAPTRGGFLDVTVTAVDGSLPSGSNVCEPVLVDATLTVSPGETLSARVKGDLCTGFYGSSVTVAAGITKEQLVYSGTAHRKVKLAGEGLVSVGVIDNVGGQGSFSAQVTW